MSQQSQSFGEQFSDVSGKNASLSFNSNSMIPPDTEKTETNDANIVSQDLSGSSVLPNTLAVNRELAESNLLSTEMEEKDSADAKDNESNDDQSNEMNEKRQAILKKSVYVGNVDYATQPQELEKHFSECGKICRITIMSDKLTGKPKGFAYLEFDTEEGAVAALALNGSTFRNRQLKIMPKRKNIFGFNAAMKPQMAAAPYGYNMGVMKKGLVRGRGRIRIMPY